MKKVTKRELVDAFKDGAMAAIFLFVIGVGLDALVQFVLDSPVFTASAVQYIGVLLMLIVVCGIWGIVSKVCDCI